ncbi:MAG: ABC transporter permease [Candidatus Omnitrophica bacterium]|nr:ABC transporter permease [Candidatus Omnitrophota bacterium]
MFLKAENLSKTYHIGSVEIRALQDVSINIEQGEFLAVMGPSGSGKSTLMHVLGFLDTPDQGAIHLLDRNISHLSEEDYAFLRNRMIGFIFQQFNLMARSTALENVELPLFYWADGSLSNERAERPLELLSRVGLRDRINHKPSELSGGQQQRVAIARALVQKPYLILADEPTGNLDSKSGKEVMQIIHELHENGMTVIIVTHDENIAAQAERIVRMQDGKIVRDEQIQKKSGTKTLKHTGEPTKTHEKRHYSFREFKEHLAQAWRMIHSNKLRSFLSMLGVLIGVACVIAMLALGRGAQESITQELARLGSNLLSVRPGSVRVRGVSMEAGTATRITLEDARAIREMVAAVKAVAPQVTGQGQMVYGSKNWSTRVLGTTPEYASMRNQDPAMGRFFTREENLSRKRVVLLGQTVARELFGSDNSIGETVKINRINFQVIGLLPTLGANTWRDQDDIVVIPLMTAMRRVLGKDYVDQIDVQIASAEAIPTAEEELKQLIVRRHRLAPEHEDSFEVRNYADIQQALSATTKTFSVLLGAVAAISLIVGGIGIMNIMLVSVKERTREIGLRKAIGASPHDILFQFLVESVMVTFLGGFAGIVLGILSSLLITKFAGWNTSIGMDSILLAFLFSAGIGMLFGIWPAKQAAKLDPIEALRYE